MEYLGVEYEEHYVCHCIVFYEIPWSRSGTKELLHLCVPRVALMWTFSLYMALFTLVLARGFFPMLPHTWFTHMWWYFVLGDIFQLLFQLSKFINRESYSNHRLLRVLCCVCTSCVCFLCVSHYPTHTNKNIIMFVIILFLRNKEDTIASLSNALAHYTR